MFSLRLWITNLLALAIASVNLASANPLSMPPLNFKWLPQPLILNASFGTVISRYGKSQQFYVNPAEERIFMAKKSLRIFPAGALFAGLQKKVTPKIFSEIGLTYQFSGQTKLQGLAQTMTPPNSNLYRYSYSVFHQLLGFKGKLLFDNGFKEMPWISASAGLGLNSAYGFSSQFFSPSPTKPQRSFREQTKMSFSYTIGLGIQRIFTPQWQAGLGYEFSDWGKNALGRAPQQSMNSGLKLNHLFTNGIIFNATYALNN